jgi:hypothetical protein
LNYPAQIADPEPEAPMIYIKTFKGYEDRTADLDSEVNDWISRNMVKVRAINSVLSHETGGRAKTGDLLYTVIYDADRPIP